MIEAILLGVLQGLTEFLPVSSSGHLAILEHRLGVAEPVTLAVFLHFGTFLAVIVFFFRPIRDLICGLVRRDPQSLSYAAKIIVGTVPIVIAGFFARNWVNAAFDNVFLVTILLGITGAVVLLTGVAARKGRPVSIFSAIAIGIGQMFAILPGISRSGMTISAGLFSGVDPDQAFRFSFLLSIPAVLGANLLELRNVSGIADVPSLAFGTACSFLAGLLALAILRRFVCRHFHLFGIYCLVLSAALIFFL